MALLDSEIQAIRWHLGYNILTVASEPYIPHAMLFEQIVKPYTGSGATTTSATAVTAASEPTPVSITLTSGTGFHAGDRVVIDVDSRQEFATVQSLSGSVVSVLLKKAHSGTYPVTVEGGETIVRRILGKLKDVEIQMESAAVTNAGLKRVEDIEWYSAAQGSGITNISLAALGETMDYWRDELAVALGVRNMRKQSGGGTSLVELY